MDRHIVRSLTAAFLETRISRLRQTGRESFIISDLIGTEWPEECLPFYQMYGERDKVAGPEMGKVLANVARGIGLTSQKEERFGKQNAITRYFFGCHTSTT